MHAAGLGELVAVSVAADVNGRVLCSDDSAIMIHTKAAHGKIGRLSYLKNCSAVIGSVPRRRDLGQAVEAIARQIAQWSSAPHRSAVPADVL